MVWAALVGAGLLEVVWAIALKQTGGFTRFWPSALGVGAAILSFVLLASALKSLPVGTAYAVGRSAPTTEIGLDPSDGSGSALGVAGAGILALGESASALRLGCLALILVGIVGLKIVEG